VPRAEVHGAGVPDCRIGIDRAGIPHPSVPCRKGMDNTVLFPLHIIS
jgi:hypothetical protein